MGVVFIVLYSIRFSRIDWGVGIPIAWGVRVAVKDLSLEKRITDRQYRICIALLIVIPAVIALIMLDRWYFGLMTIVLTLIAAVLPYKEDKTVLSEPKSNSHM